MAEYKIFYEDEWAALYIDGQLETVGDTSVTYEYALNKLGVTIESDNSFMRGQHYYDGVAKSLDELEAYRNERAVNLLLADEKRRKAEALLAEAAELEGKHRD